MNRKWDIIDTTLLCLTFYEPPFLPHGIFLAFKYFTILFLLVKYGMESDEIFNCDSNSIWGIKGQRFGDIANIDFCVSYAASCGYTGAENIRADDRKTIESGLKKLSHISVRDKNTFNFVKDVSGRAANYNLDPVLIYDFYEEVRQGEKEGIPIEPYSNNDFQSGMELFSNS